MQNNEVNEPRKTSHVKLFSVLEAGGGTVNIFTIEGFLPKGDFQFEELPGRVFNIQSDKAIIETLLERYRNGGVLSVEQYLHSL